VHGSFTYIHEFDDAIELLAAGQNRVIFALAERGDTSRPARDGRFECHPRSRAAWLQGISLGRHWANKVAPLVNSCGAGLSCPRMAQSDGSQRFISEPHGIRQPFRQKRSDLKPLLSEDVAASPAAPGRPDREPAVRAGDAQVRPARALQRTARSHSPRTRSRRARSSGSPCGRWPAHDGWRAGSGSCRNNRCDRTWRTASDGATSRR
jgi:hypothetical protein